MGQRVVDAQRKAKDRLVDKLVDANEFAVPGVFVERQIDNRLEQRVGFARHAAGHRCEVAGSRLA